MYTRWRPVPSARTVRILYQLGYICTGTACGLATLCLEEQRRRIQILQRIADNAKVLRQHSRYRGNLALATANEEEYEPTDVDAEAPSTPERLAKRRTRSLLQPSGGNDGGTSSGSLPSAIQEPYAGLFDGSKPETDGNADSTGHGPSTSRSERYANRHISLDSHTPARKRSVLPDPASGERRRIRRVESRPLFETQEPDSRQYRTLVRVNQESQSYFESNKSRWIGSSDPDPLVSGRSQGDSAINPSHSIEESAKQDVTAEDVNHDVNLFLWETSNALKSTPLSNSIVVGKLFRTAIRVGSLENIRVLWLWKLMNGHFTSADAEYICKSCGTLSTRYDQTRLDAFFASVFTSECFSTVDLHMQLQMAFIALGRCFDERISFEDFSFLRAVRYVCRRMEEPVVLKTLEEISKDLVTNGEPKGAVMLFIWIATPHRSKSISFQQLTLLDALFEAVASSGSLRHCATLLRWKARHTSYETVLPMINSFVQLCDEQDAEGLLAAVFTRRSGIRKHLKGWQRLLDDLTPRCRTKLAAILSASNTISEEVYQGLSPSEYSKVNESAMKMLKYGWRSTRNLEDVDSRIRTLAKRLKEIGDQKALTELDEIAFEIYVSASKMDLAMTTIARMHKESRVSNLALCQTAFMFAKQGLWDSFSRVLDVMRGWADFRIDQATMRTFNATLHIFCRYHSVDQILKFVTGIITELGFTPNTSTSAIVLESLVTKQRLDVFAKWADLISTPERSWQIDSSLVAGLLRRFYVDQRPSHIFMMLLCRKLTVLAPSFANKDLKALVEQSLAYDLRHRSGNHDAWMKSHAKKRLERLQEATQDLIPSPGFAWNEHLYFHDYENDINVSEVQSPTIVEDASKQQEDPDESPFDEDITFEALRADENGERVSIQQLQIEDEFTTRGKKRLEGQMWLHISTKDYERALQLYHDTLDVAGIPASPDILELAIEAVLRRDGGDKSNALVLMERAQEAGMNTTCAMGPLLLHQLRTLSPDGELDGVALLKSVIQYYESNDENGWRVSHYVGVHAAHTLQMHRQWHTGLSLMSSIYNSKWAQKLPLDIVALTVFLRGYIALQSVEGVQWVVQTVLDKNLRISKKFMKQLRQLTRGNYKWMDRHSRSLHPLFDSWLQSCEERQDHQTAETHRLGWELVEQIANLSNDKSSVGDHLPLYVHDRSRTDESSTTEAAEYNDFVDESYYSDESLEEASEPTKLENLRKRIVDDWNAEQVFRRRMKKAALAQGTQDRQSHLVIQREDEEGVFDVWKTGSEYNNLNPGTEDQIWEETLLDTVSDVESGSDGEMENVQIMDTNQGMGSFQPSNNTPFIPLTAEGDLDFQQTSSEHDVASARKEDRSSDENLDVTASDLDSRSEEQMDVASNSGAHDDLAAAFDRLTKARKKKAPESVDLFKPFS